MNQLTIQDGYFYILSGPSASGKSTFVEKILEKGLPKDCIISMDMIKKQFLGYFQTIDDFGIEKNSLYGWEIEQFNFQELIVKIINIRLEQKLLTILDATNLNDEIRKKFVDIASDYGVTSKVIIFNEDTDILLDRLHHRIERFDDSVIYQQLSKFQKDSIYDYEIYQKQEIKIQPNLLNTDKIDVIGDCHGLLSELIDLLKNNGWIYNQQKECFYPIQKDRKLLFLGDIIDRGTESIQLLKAIKNTVENKNGFFILGNHEDKLLKIYDEYKKNKKIIAKSLSSSQTFIDFLKLSEKEQKDFILFLKSSPISFSLWIDKKTGNVTFEENENIFKIGFCHANNEIFKEISFPKSIAIYGSKMNKKNTDEIYQKNYDKKLNKHILIRGHIPNMSEQDAVYSLDDRQAFEGNLMLLNLEKYIQTLKENNWKSKTKLFINSVEKYKTNFNFDKYVEPKIKLLRDLKILEQKNLIYQKNNELNGLKIYKYSPKVHYKNLWKENYLLQKTRGLVLDIAGNIVVHPFDKIKNFHTERINIALDKKVLKIDKMNGFLGCISLNPYTQELLLSTTGSIDISSPYIQKIEKYIVGKEIQIKNFLQKNNMTLLFEVIHPEDPHIIEYTEKDYGLWLIGARNKEINSSLLKEKELDIIAKELNFKRPFWEIETFSNILNHMKNNKKEGFILRDIENEEPIMKIKTTYYLLTKFLGRLKSDKIDFMYDKTQKFKEKEVEEEFYQLIDEITTKKSKNDFLNMTEKERTNFVRELVNNNLINFSKIKLL